MSTYLLQLYFMFETKCKQEVENSVIYLEVCFLENRICNLNNAYAGINLFILAQSPMELLLLEHCHVLHNPLQDNNWENWEGAQVKEAASIHPFIQASFPPSSQSILQLHETG